MKEMRYRHWCAIISAPKSKWICRFFICWELVSSIRKTLVIIIRTRMSCHRCSPPLCPVSWTMRCRRFLRRITGISERIWVQETKVGRIWKWKVFFPDSCWITGYWSMEISVIGITRWRIRSLSGTLKRNGWLIVRVIFVWRHIMKRMTVIIQKQIWPRKGWVLCIRRILISGAICFSGINGKYVISVNKKRRKGLNSNR